MTKTQIILVGALALGSLAISLIIEHRSQTALASQAMDLHRQQAEMAALLGDRERLTNRLAHAAEQRQKEALAELATLREEAGALQKRIQQRTEKQAAQAASQTTTAPAPAVPKSPEYFRKLHQLAGTSNPDAMALGMGIRLYANDHQGQVPATVDDLKPYLLKAEMPLAGTNQFDIVYHGSMEALAQVPGSAVALTRDRRIWTAPSGKSARVYGMADGSARIVESDDDFRSWEAQHLVPKP